MALVLAGCGSVSMRTIQPTEGPAPLLRPQKIQVLPFESGDCFWGLEVSAADEAMIKSRFPDQLLSAMLGELNKIAPASKTDVAGIGGSWLIQGRLSKVLLPDPAQKDSKRKPVVECTVFVFDMGRSQVQPFLTYKINAKEVFPDPLAESTDSAKSEYLDLESKESARLLADSLKEYMKNRGWPVKP